MGDVQKHDPSSIAEILSQIKLRYRLSDEGVEDECFIKLEEFLTDKNIIKIIFLKCRVFRLYKIDLIIGRPSIKLHGFANISSSHFGKSEPDMPMTTIVSTPTPRGRFDLLPPDLSCGWDRGLYRRYFRPISTGTHTGRKGTILPRSDSDWRRWGITSSY